jgi:hypothetical protein
MDRALERELLAIAGFLELKDSLAAAPPPAASRLRSAVDWLKSVICPKARKLDELIQLPESEIAIIIADAIAVFHINIAPPLTIAKHVNRIGLSRFCDDPTVLLNIE